MIASVRPPLSVIASGASFGMALAASGVPVRKIAESLESLKGFDAVEFPVEILELKEASRLLAGAINGFQYLHIGSIIDRAPSRLRVTIGHTSRPNSRSPVSAQ